MALSRFPHGKRGLKSDVNVGVTPPNQSLPTREAWIEIELKQYKQKNRIQSLPTREAWIEIIHTALAGGDSKSRFPHGKRGLK